MNQLIISALQERRINRDHRLHAGRRESCRKGQRVLFGDSDIEIALGMLLRKTHHPGTFAHGRRNRHQLWLPGSHVAQPVAENLAVTRLARRFGNDAIGRRKLANTVVQNRVFFRRQITFPLSGHHVQELWAIELAQVRQRRHQNIEIMPVDRPDVVETEFFEQCAGHDHALHVLFCAPRKVEYGRYSSKYFFARPPGSRVEPSGQKPRQIIVQRSDILRN